MARITIGFGVLLILLGVIGYALWPVHWTALLPAIFGAIFVLLGVLALNDRYRKHAMHVAAALAVIGFLGTMRGVVSVIRMLGGAEIERPPAAVSQAIMAVLSLIFVGLCVKSFIDARRARTGAETTAPPPAE